MHLWFAASLYDACARLKALYMKHASNTQPDSIIKALHSSLCPSLSLTSIAETGECLGQFGWELASFYTLQQVQDAAATALLQGSGTVSSHLHPHGRSWLPVPPVHDPQWRRASLLRGVLCESVYALGLLYLDRDNCMCYSVSSLLVHLCTLVYYIDTDNCPHASSLQVCLCTMASFI